MPELSHGIICSKNRCLISFSLVKFGKLRGENMKAEFVAPDPSNPDVYPEGYVRVTVTEEELIGDNRASAEHTNPNGPYLADALMGDLDAYWGSFEIGDKPILRFTPRDMDPRDLDKQMGLIPLAYSEKLTQEEIESLIDNL
jgi:hypothetical protein